MRTLNQLEVEQVSGAGFIADISSALGSTIGAMVDNARHRTNNAGKVLGGKVGRGIGEIVEAQLAFAEQVWGKPATRR